jgi:RNA polymerase sigma factor (sigma-70 family)
MGSRQADAVRHGLTRLVEAQAAELSDAELLRHFAATRDDEAFAALLRRHGSLVYGVCRNVLRHEHDAQDAFQATFLVLARRAAAVRDERALASWLYRVAFRVAVKARKAADRRRQQERQAAKPEAEQPRGELAWRELQAMLDEELNRLPEKYRAPFVLCCLTGRSKSEAAAELGWKEGTVSSRLAQARAILQGRLARRGVALTAVLSGLALSEGGAAGGVPSALLAATRASAVAFAGGESLPAAAPVTVARAVLLRMSLDRLKPAAVLLAVLGLVGAAAVALYRPPEPELTERVVTLTLAPLRPPVPGAEAPAPAKTMTVGGAVTEPGGQPLPGARVVVVAARGRRPGEPPAGLYAMRVLGEGRADENGQFRVAAEQTTADANSLAAVALVPGYAPAGRGAEPTTVTATEHTLPIRVVRGQTVRARLVGPDGRPAAGVRVHLLGLYRNVNPGGISVRFHEPPPPGTGWPDPVTTDDGGNFTLTDVAPGTRVSLLVRDERFAPQWLELQTGPTERADPVLLPLAPVRTLEGRVTADDTGEPLAGALVVVEVSARPGLVGRVETRTDAAGRFRVRPFPGPSGQVWVSPPADRPYLEASRTFPWPANALTHQLEVSPLRGVLVRGTVTEVDSGRPVPGAVVTYEHRTDTSPLQAKEVDRMRQGIRWHARDTRAGPDGAFALTVPPGDGTLLVGAAEPDYLHVETSSTWLAQGTPGGWPVFADALVPLSLNVSDSPHEVAAKLRRGVTVRGRVVGHDGRPVSGVLFTPSYLPEGMHPQGFPLPVRDGRFELPGCDPGKPVTVWVYDPRMREGAVASFTAGAGEPEVRLAPCVSVRVRAVDKAGKPLAVTQWVSEMLFRPGRDGNRSARLGVETIRVYGRDYGPRPAGEQAVVFRDLIPGATYLVLARVGQGMLTALTTFTAPPTGSLDLGDVTLTLPDLTGPALRE